MPRLYASTRVLLTLAATLALLLEERRPGCAAELESAHAVYADKLADAKEGVQRAEGLLFVVVEIADASKMREETLQARCLLRTVELLRYFASDHSRDADGTETKDVPATNAVLRQFPFLLAECRQVNPRFATRNIELKNISSRVLVNGAFGKTRRFVTALAESDFDKQVAAMPPAAPAIDETLAHLRKRMASLREDQPSEVASLLLRCGAVEDVLSLANDESWLEFSLSSFGQPRWDSVELYERWQSAHDLVAAPETSVRDIRQLLRDWPGFPPALRWLSRNSLNDQQHAAAVNFGLLSLIDELKSEETNRDVVAMLEQWETVTKSAHGLVEYSRLLGEVLKAELPEGVRQPDHPSAKLVSRVWRTCGHVNIPDLQDNAQTKKAESAVDRIRNAKDLGTASKLFHDAIAENPVDATTWEAMGNVLLASDAPLAAIPFLTQSLRIAPDSTSARLSLATCYQRLGHDQLRRGAAFSALVQPSITDAERESALVHMQETGVASEKPAQPSIPASKP